MFLEEKNVLITGGARRVGAETPIIDEIYAILYQDRDVPAAIRNLMCRSAKPEV